jgi:hypothetical protein
MQGLTFVYLVQGAWARLSQLHFPAVSPVLALCHDHDGSLPSAEETIFDPKCTWAAGRNRLRTLALSRYPDADYFIFCDDDIVFAEGSFMLFEAMLTTTRPAVGVPIVPKALLWKTAVTTLEVQRGLCLDEQMVALHRSIMGEAGIAPLETAYDEVSWYAACLIFEYSVLKQYASACHQYNRIRIENPRHTVHDGSTLYRIGHPHDYLPLVIDWILKRKGSYDDTIIDPYEGSRHAGSAARARAALVRAQRLSRIGELDSV